eukprot:scaffold7179_cov72-Cyclotella_meneghiniana.AAC.1
MRGIVENMNVPNLGFLLSAETHHLGWLLVHSSDAADALFSRPTSSSNVFFALALLAIAGGGELV